MTLGYDAAGRLATLTLPAGTITLGYQPATGALNTVSGPDAGTSVSYTYDGSLVTSEDWAGPVAGSVTRTYDADFRVVSETVAGTPAATFAYDGDGLLTRAGR